MRRRRACFTLMARTDPADKGAGGISAFIVETRHAGHQLRQASTSKMGQQRRPHLRRHLRQLPRAGRQPDRRLEEGQGFKTAMKVLDKGRIHIAAVCVGVARAHAATTRCATPCERKQFGQPIAEFQLVQAMLADSQAELYAARCMVLDAARRRDEGRQRVRPRPRAASCSPPRCAAASPTARCRSSAAPATWPNTASSASTATCALFRLYEGTTQIQQLIIARNMIREACDGRGLAS